MSATRMVILAAALSVLPLSIAFAGGAGGLTWGQQFFDPALSNSDFPGTFSGGYGYGVTGHGQRIGGFGLAVRSLSPTGGLDGGFGGLILGQEAHGGPFLFALNLWTGVGGLSANPALPGKGSLALFEELDVELGLGFIPWMELTGYAGMQAIMRVGSGSPLFRGALYTPVLGVRVAWGSF